MDSASPNPPANKSWFGFLNRSQTTPSGAHDEYDTYLEQARFTDLIDNPQTLTARQKKWRRFRSTMGNAKNNAMNGAMIGAMVGGMFGFVVGLYSAVQTRRLISIPFSVIVSGGTFAFIMGCGSMIRSESDVPPYHPDNYWTVVHQKHKQK